MQLKDVMSRSVVSVDANDTVLEASNKMTRENVHFAPVILEDVCCGVITTHDIFTRVIAAGRDPATTFVTDVMTRSDMSDPAAESHMNARLFTLPEDAEIEEAVHLMDQHQVSHVAVRDDDFQMVGIVSRHDLEFPEHVEAEH